MIRHKLYSEEEKADKVWVDSSNVYFIRMEEDDKENKGNLFITFKNGTTYKYKDVELGDYILFARGGMDGSHGKALNKIIKPKYEFEKVENGPTIAEIDDELAQILRAEEQEDEDYESEDREYLEDLKVFFKGLIAMIDGCDHNEDDEKITVSNIMDELKSKIDEYEK